MCYNIKRKGIDQIMCQIIRNVLIYCFYYHHVLRIVGVTKNKKIVTQFKLSRLPWSYLDPYGGDQLIDSGKDLKIQMCRSTVKRKILNIGFDCVVLYFSH